MRRRARPNNPDQRVWNKTCGQALIAVDPRLAGSDQWQQLALLGRSLVLFVALALNAAFAFLLAHAVLPSLNVTDDATVGVRALRWVLYPIFLASVVLTAIALARAIGAAAAVVQQVYPRFEL